MILFLDDRVDDFFFSMIENIVLDIRCQQNIHLLTLIGTLVLDPLRSRCQNAIFICLFVYLLFLLW